jgi:hypothetical protein
MDTERWRRWACGRCGAESTVGDDDGGWAHCDRCEDEYQDWLAREYPYGQCQECGAEGYPVRRYDRQRGRVVEVVRFSHAEGGCSQWTDWTDYDAVDDDVAAYRGSDPPAWLPGEWCFPEGYDGRDGRCGPARPALTRPK